MNITEEFVEMMICPACKGKVKLKPDGSGIKCVECRRVYPIEDGIPAMLV
ncbi:MAG: Trm112 family protein, partial [Pyrinomonadaceae bacterium]